MNNKNSPFWTIVAGVLKFTEIGIVNKLRFVWVDPGVEAKFWSNQDWRKWQQNNSIERLSVTETSILSIADLYLS